MLVQTLQYVNFELKNIFEKLENIFAFYESYNYYLQTRSGYCRNMRWDKFESFNIGKALYT